MRSTGYVLAVLVMTGASVLAASCGDDNISTMPTGGSSGGRAGSSATGGKGGGGSTGAGGSTTGGAGGTAGAGGSTAGSGGATGGRGVGGTAGTSGGSAGLGGGDASAGSGGSAGTQGDASPDNRTDAAPDVSTGGDGATSDATEAQAPDATDAGSPDAVSTEAAPGEGGEAGPVAVKSCVVTCTTSDDCQPDGAVKTLVCDTTKHHCVSCVHDITCTQRNSLWTKCTSDAGCNPDSSFPLGDFCVDVEGSGYCAFSNTNVDNCFGFDDMITIKKFGSSEMVTVCADASQKCDSARGACIGPCGGLGAPACTPARGGKVCNATTKKCECGSSTDCGPGAPTCNLVTKQCECGDTNDCSAFDSGATYVCE